MPVEAIEYKTISIMSRPIRYALTSITKDIFKSSFSGDGLKNAAAQAKKGYGTLLFCTHPGKGETVRLIREVIENDVLYNRGILVPFAVHQFSKTLELLGKASGITLCPITTEDTIKYVAEHPLEKPKYRYALSRGGKAELIGGYVSKIPEFLSNGRTVIVFFQGGRQAFLENTPTDAASLIIGRTNRPKTKVDNYTITTIGVDVEGIEDFTDEEFADSTNKGVEYTFNADKTLGKLGFIAQAKQWGLTLDELVLVQARIASPNKYLQYHNFA